MNSLETHQEQLLDILSSALFGVERSVTPLTPKIIKEAKQQAVFTLMPVEKEPSLDVYILYTQTLDHNVRIDCEHAQAHRLMTEAGIPYVVLKGAASAAYYPEPLFRRMGDVDLLVAKSDLSKIDIMMRENGFSRIENNEENFHLAYCRELDGNDSTWEIHWRPNGVPEGKLGTKILCYLENIIASAEHCKVTEAEYMVPTAFHHGLVMLLHAASHLINTGIGLRHLCDWAVFVATFSDEEFCEMYEDKLKSVGLWRFAQLLTQLSVKYLQCPAKDWCGVADEAYLETLMIDIMNAGNFGTKDRNRINQAKLMTDTGKGKVDDTSLWKQFFHTMNDKARRGMPITKRLPILLPVGWIYVGVRHFVRIKQGKRPNINIKDMVTGAKKRRDIYKEFRLFEEEV